MRSTLTPLVFGALLVALLVPAASAATIKARYDGMERYVGVHYYYSGTNGTADAGTTAGRFRWELLESTGVGGYPYLLDANDEFRTFCIELKEFISVNQTPTYTLTDPELAPVDNPGPGGGLPMGTAKEALLERLFATYGDLALTSTDNAEVAGFQLAVWEISYEESGVFDLDSGGTQGSFYATGSAAANAKANYYLNNLGSDSWEMTALSDESYQDHIIRVVPLPPAAALGFMLLGGLGLVRRIRRNRRG